jgi:nitrite reductase/ring-hydroxylating ferredoxin subunit
VTTGVAVAPEKGRVEVYPVKVVGEDVLVEIEVGR